MDQNTPVIFSDGTQFFKQLAKTYKRHQTGYFILAPSGSGKTYFVEHQTEKNWMDGDMLWPAAKADLTDDGWDVPFEIVMEVNSRSDVITEQAKKQGFWVIGASNRWLKPDAIVLPDWRTHKNYVIHREQGQYDGGAKEENFEGLKSHRRWIAKWKKQGVPCFRSVQEAALFLGNQKTN